MRKHLLLPLGVAALFMIASCKKFDLPPKKFCQVTSFNNTFQGFGFTYSYVYTNNRLLQSIQLPFVTFSIEYDQHKRPVFVRDNFNVGYQLIYQHGRVVRVDEQYGNGPFTPKYTYAYDHKGRVIERTDATSIWRWEYIGHTHNFSSKTNLVRDAITGQLKPIVRYEYHYDHKIHPWSTWIHLPLNPFFIDLHEGSAQLFEPVPENNWTYQRVYGYPGSQQTLGQEFFYTYEYDGPYPIKRAVRHIGYGSTPPSEGTGESVYTYDCAGDEVKLF